jgi:diaminohydroxyphosphoribosylaminopyrimidine deaminase/5-amino-6-(5-phosphoribosylamino)uracil reductase
MTPDATHIDHRDWMLRSIDLAIGGRGRVEPNPMVGCVIVKDNRVIGQGRHEVFGGPHAEPMALDACSESPAGATAYVTLEPCVHTNKKTPPCVPRLIAAGLARVVVGCVDPNPPVAGAGIAALRNSGIAVETGLLEEHCRQLNAPYFATTAHHRPYVTLKWAQSADGAVAGANGRPIPITADAANRAVHALRGRCDAILIGGQTATGDDPLLTARLVPPLRIPLRSVLSAKLCLSPDSRLAQSTDSGPVLVYCTQSSLDGNRARALMLERQRVEVQALPSDEHGRIPLPAALDDLHRRSVTHLLIEPGPALAAGFLAANLADRVWVFHSPKRIDDPTAPRAAAVPFAPTARLQLGADLLTEHLNPRSPVFFANDPSPDLRLLQLEAHGSNS